ncbi:hypothetical protein C8Q74DRAFT_1248388 [Fomes fomentarius]|nr:hypothetical protein C8Q74DRAFT_1248388 [Fomes fomentarius]
MIQIVETITTALSMHTAYYNLVTNFANPFALLRGPVWSLKLLPVPGSIAAVMTQLFFARRVYMLKKRYRPIAIIAAVLTVAFSGCYIALTGLGWNAANITQFLKFSWLPSLGSAKIMVGDLMMTTVLIYFLHQNRTGVTRTDSMVDVIIMYTVSTGLIICIFNVLNVTFSLVWPNNLIYAGTSIVLTKLYSNTFLVSLNARQSLINRGVVMEATSPFTSAIVGKRETRSTGNSSHGSRRRVQVPLEIQQVRTCRGIWDTSHIRER